jgi:hypothetical protein
VRFDESQPRRVIGPVRPSCAPEWL